MRDEGVVIGDNSIKIISLIKITCFLNKMYTKLK